MISFLGKAIKLFQYNLRKALKNLLNYGMDDIKYLYLVQVKYYD